jgi:hypothetical protein
MFFLCSVKTNETSLKDALNAFVEAHGLKEKLLETELRQKWESIAGATVARYTKKLYVKKKKLYLEVTTAVIKQEITYSKTGLLEIIRKEIGPDFVDDIILF